MALGYLQDNVTTTNDNSNHRRHRILSACGGFLFSWKSVARGALHPVFCQNAPFPPKSNKTAPAAKPLTACCSQKMTFSSCNQYLSCCGVEVLICVLFWMVVDVLGRQANLKESSESKGACGVEDTSISCCYNK